MIQETKKYVCDECGNTFEANLNVINPNCTVCQVVHIENPGFNPVMNGLKENDITAIAPTQEDLTDFFTNFDEDLNNIIGGD